jgi:hypothetical protein
MFYLDDLISKPLEYIYNIRDIKTFKQSDCYTTRMYLANPFTDTFIIKYKRNFHKLNGFVA